MFKNYIKKEINVHIYFYSLLTADAGPVFLLCNLPDTGVEIFERDRNLNIFIVDEVLLL